MLNAAGDECNLGTFPGVASRFDAWTERNLHTRAYLVVAAESHEENNCLDIVEAVHPFSPLAALSPDVYQGVPVSMKKAHVGDTTLSHSPDSVCP